MKAVRKLTTYDETENLCEAMIADLFQACRRSWLSPALEPKSLNSGESNARTAAFIYWMFTEEITTIPK